MNEPKQQDKPFQISKWKVWEAYERVKANKGAAGVNNQSIAEFEADRDRNLYKVWNRMSSGSYFPPPVKAVEIPKAGGTGVRLLGVPTVADRVAQTVARLYLEPQVEPVFHPDSYGYRPASRRWTRSRHAGSGAGGRTGWSIWTSGRSLTPCPGTSCARRSPITSHRASGGSCCMWSGGSKRHSSSQMAPWWPGIADPAGVSDLTVDRQPVHALRVRRLDGAGFPGHPVRAVLR